TNPASSTQAKYTGLRNKLVFESSFSLMDGKTEYSYQPDTDPNAIRVVDNTRSFADKAATRHEAQPNSRLQFDNIASYSVSGLGQHLFKGGVQFGRLKYESQYDVHGNYYLIYNDGAPTSVQQFNTPTDSLNRDNILGFFAQDGWTIGRRLTLNLGVRV